MSIVSRPASQAYRDNFPFPDRRAVKIEGAPVAPGPAQITARADVIRVGFVNGYDCKDVDLRLAPSARTYDTEADARAQKEKSGYPHIFKFELRITALDDSE